MWLVPTAGRNAGGRIKYHIDTYSKIFIRRIAGSNPVELTLSFWRNGLRIDLENRLSIYVSSYAGIV